MATEATLQIKTSKQPDLKRAMPSEAMYSLYETAKIKQREIEERNLMVQLHPISLWAD